MKVLVCGGRSYFDWPQLFGEMDRLMPIDVLIHGGAGGADTLAGNWAAARGVPVEKYPADWKRDGKAAGPIRNQKMLVNGKPGLVVAFPGGRGTADMIRRAEKAGVQVLRIAARESE